MRGGFDTRVCVFSVVAFFCHDSDEKSSVFLFTASFLVVSLSTMSFVLFFVLSPASLTLDAQG